MAHSSRRLTRLLAAAGVLLGLVAPIGAAYAASALYFHDGPNWHQSGNYYSFGVCSDTQVGEKVWLQYSTDGNDLTNPPNAGNGIHAMCDYADAITCPGASYWRCRMPDNSGLTVKYRFYVLTAVNTWSGLVTPQRFFTTGELAVRVNSLSARSVPSGPDSALTSLMILAAIIVFCFVLGVALGAALRLHHH